MLRSKLTRALVVVVAAAALAAGAYTLRVLPRQEATQPAPVAVAAPAAPALAADGYVVPNTYTALSVATPGRVAAIKVSEGQQVAAGETLLILEDSLQRQALAQARAGLASAQARLSQLKAGPRAEELAQAEAAVAAARARLDRLTMGASEAQVGTARQAVAVAQADLDRAKSGATPEQLNVAASAVAQAEAALKQAQAAYDRVAGNPDIASRPEALKLEQATNEYNRARASYQNLLNGPTAAEVKVYEARVAQAQAGLNEVQAAPNPADVSAARAELARTEAAAALLRAGAAAEEIAAQEAQVTLAQAQVDQSQAALEQTVLTAPFAGTVGALNANVGQYLAPGQTAVQLGDTSAWSVETDNLTEGDVVNIKPGEGLTVTIDALSGQTLTGKVERIQPAAQIKRGEVTYKVTLSLPATDLPLRWGMTAAVSK